MSLLTPNLLKRILDVGDRSLTSKEISAIILLAKIQDDKGYCFGVYWQHISEYGSISKSGYYHVIKELESKKFIRQDESHNICMNIYVLDNNIESLSSEDDKYIDLNLFVFDDKEFYKLKANEKRLLLHLILDSKDENTFTDINNVYELYRKYSKLLNTKEKCVSKYFTSIEKWVKIKANSFIFCSSVLAEEQDHIELVVKKNNEAIYEEIISNERLKQIIESRKETKQEKTIEILF